MILRASMRKLIPLEVLRLLAPIDGKQFLISSFVLIEDLKNVYYILYIY